MFPLLDVSLTGGDLVDLVIVAGIVVCAVILLKWLLSKA
jgi:hypothetical protein